MKKLLSILLVCVLAISLFVACGEKDEVKEEYNILTQEESKDAPDVDNGTKESEEPKETETPEKSKKNQKTEEPLASSENKDVVTKDNAPEVHIINSGSTNNARICYHLESCKLLKGTDHQKVTWEMIELIQFRQCPECNPPRYENYVE